MTGVFHDAERGKLVATDGFKLVVIDDDTIKKTEIIDPKTGKVINANFPQYEVVIPKDSEIKRTVNVKEMLAQLHGLADTSKYFRNAIAARIKIGGQYYYFKSENMRDVFSVMAERGIEEVELGLSTNPNRSLIIESNKGVMGLIMPVYTDGRMGAKTIHESPLTKSESNIVISEDIDKLNVDRKSIEKSYKEAIANVKKANPKTIENDKFEVYYNKQRLDEIDAQISEKKSKLIDNQLAEQQDLQTVKNSIENEQITSEKATEYIEQDVERTREIEQSISDIERKAESDNEVELNEVIRDADKLINGEQTLPSQSDVDSISTTLSDIANGKDVEIEGFTPEEVLQEIKYIHETEDARRDKESDTEAEKRTSTEVSDEEYEQNKIGGEHGETKEEYIQRKNCQSL